MLYMISIGSFILSILSFILLAIIILLPLLQPHARTAEGIALAQQQAVEGWAKLAEALSKLIDSLNKSSPTVITFLSSMGFMIISLAAAKS
jgi:hypothetical protein